MAIIHITKSNYDTVVSQNDKVLLDFWAPWCGPCRMVAPILDELARDNESIVIGKVNVDEEMELATRFGIVSIPTLVVLENGRKTVSAVGYRPKADIEKLLGI